MTSSTEHVPGEAEASAVEPPFEEATSVRAQRHRAVQLARSDLPILILGEPGTGRRTLAAAVAHLRAQSTRTKILRLEGVQGLDAAFRETMHRRAPVHVIAYDVHALQARQQLELAHWVHTKQVRLVAVSKLETSREDQPDRPEALAPELALELNLTQVVLPPLRDRDDDVLEWANFFLERAASRLQVPPPRFTTGCRQGVLRHRWPGNLIELDAVIHRTLCLGSKPELEAADLGLPDGEEAIVPLNEAVERFRSDYIARALAHFSGNRSQAARALKVDVRTVFRHLEARRK